jgi:hypothetical protein
MIATNQKSVVAFLTRSCQFQHINVNTAHRSYFVIGGRIDPEQLSRRAGDRIQHAVVECQAGIDEGLRECRRRRRPHIADDVVLQDPVGNKTENAVAADVGQIVHSRLGLRHRCAQITAVGHKTHKRGALYCVDEAVVVVERNRLHIVNNETLFSAPSPKKTRALLEGC